MLLIISIFDNQKKFYNLKILGLQYVFLIYFPINLLSISVIRLLILRRN